MVTIGKKLMMKQIVSVIIISMLIMSCKEDDLIPANEEGEGEIADSTDYPGVPKSDIYEVTIINENGETEQVVFQSTCPEYQLGKMNMVEKDKYPLNIFAGRSISWTNFSLSGSTTVEIKVIDKGKVPVTGEVKILPSRYGISSTVEGNTIRFTVSQPGQFSVEIGENGYKNGLMIFADPAETEVPDQTSNEYAVLENITGAQMNNVAPSYSGLYFKSGVHNIGVYHVPAHIKNIYLESGSWVYGALIMDGDPNVKIFGRGVLSGGKLNYRESHSIEAINQSNNIHIEGIVIADPKHFGVRLIGENNNVHWTKVIGGWVYNTDGIAAYAGSTVSNCFIWANDDAIKVYRDNITWTDCIVWQLNNGGIIQMSWGGSNATNVAISGLDVLRAEWNKPGFNRALLSCVGNRYQSPGKYGLQKDWLIEDVVTETPIPVIFNITPDNFSPNHIHDLTLKNWNVKMIENTDYENMIIGNDPDEYFDGFVFENFIFNGTKLTESNWMDITAIVAERLNTPEFK